MAISKPTASEVLSLTGLDIDTAVVDSVIDDAVLIAKDCIEGYEANRQEAIVKWLSGHLLASTHDGGVLTSEKLGDASDSYARASMGDSLKGTTYGQQALALDPNGCLAKLGRAKASIQVV